jgi:hypothetical protein
MTQMTRPVLFACAVAIAGVSTLSAQTPQAAPASPEPPRGFVSISAGGQLSGRTLSESGSFTLYDEAGSFTSSTDVSKGLVFDIGGGVAVWKQLSIGAAFSRFSKNTSGTVAATVPNPLYYDRPRSVTVPVSALVHAENAFHIQAIWQLIAREKCDLSIVGGPSIFSLKTDSVAGVTATEVGAPYTTVTVTPTTSSASKSAVGVNIGVDATYLVRPRIGIGMFLRYAGASVELPAAGGGTTSVKVGGPQIGIGLRYRF